MLPAGCYQRGATCAVLPAGSYLRFYLQGATYGVLIAGCYLLGVTSRMLPPGCYLQGATCRVCYRPEATSVYIYIYKKMKVSQLRVHTTDVRLMPPLSFFLNVMFGGALLRRMPNPSSSCSSSFLCCSGLRTSSTMNMRLQVRATATQLKCLYTFHCIPAERHIK